MYKEKILMNVYSLVVGCADFCFSAFLLAVCCFLSLFLFTDWSVMSCRLPQTGWICQFQRRYESTLPLR
jgi:hypothetical protein